MLLVFSLFVMLLGHFTSPADCNDEQEDMVEDLHNGHGRKPKTESKKAPGCPKETASRHFPVPDHLLVVRVLQENLSQERLIEILEGFITLTTSMLSSAYLATANSSKSSAAFAALVALGSGL